MAHKNFHTKHCARYTQCIHVSTHKLKLPKTFMPIKYKHPSQPPTQVELDIVVKCKNIYRVFYFICIYGNVHHTRYNISESYNSKGQILSLFAPVFGIKMIYKSESFSIVSLSKFHPTFYIYLMVGFVSESTNLPLPISKSHPTFGKHITVDFDRDNKEKKKPCL